MYSSKENRDPIVKAFCCECHDELEEGQEVVKFEQEHFCDMDCFVKYYNVETINL